MINNLKTVKDKLHKEDTITQTFGCRHTNPDICSNNSIPGICAFTSDDYVCKRPPRSWKKIFEKLKKAEGKNERFIKFTRFV